MTIITLELPDDIAKQAQHKGLLSSAAITALLKQVLAQQQQTLSLVDVMQTSPHRDIEIMQESQPICQSETLVYERLVTRYQYFI